MVKISAGLRYLAVISLALLPWAMASRGPSSVVHAWSAALPLFLIAAGCAANQVAARSAPRIDGVRAALLTVAFICWGLNQVWSDPSQAVVMNDVAIVTFVLEAFLGMSPRFAGAK